MLPVIALCSSFILSLPLYCHLFLNVSVWASFFFKKVCLARPLNLTVSLCGWDDGGRAWCGKHLVFEVVLVNTELNTMLKFHTLSCVMSEAYANLLDHTNGQIIPKT